MYIVQYGGWEGVLYLATQVCQIVFLVSKNKLLHTTKPQLRKATENMGRREFLTSAMVGDRNAPYQLSLDIRGPELKFHAMISPKRSEVGIYSSRPVGTGSYGCKFAAQCCSPVDEQLYSATLLYKIEKTSI